MMSSESYPARFVYRRRMPVGKMRLGTRECMGGTRAMQIALTLEERLAAVEKEIRELKQGKVPVQPKHSWLEKISGTFKDDPEFGEILRLGREIRKTEIIEEANGDA
jgi:hypothetical protein